MTGPTRRAVLRASPVLLGALAGCDALDAREDDSPTTTTPPSSETDGGGTEVEMVAPVRELDLRNVGDDDRFVSVAIRDGETVVSSTTVEVPAGTQRTFSLPAPTGVLSVEVETTDGVTASHDWVVGDAMGDLRVTLRGDDLQFSQSAWCTPTCEPLSKGGTAAEFPYYGEPVFVTSYYGANVVVTNDANRTVDVTVGIEHDGESILDYRYAVPPDVTLEFPGVHSAGSYTVTVASAVGDLEYDWAPPKERRLQVTLTPVGVQATCGETDASFVLRNDDTSVHKVDVLARRPGDETTAFSASYIVQPGANYRERGVFTGSGQYVLDVRTGEGATERYDWWLCPPRGPTEITIQPNGRLHVVQYQPGE